MDSQRVETQDDKIGIGGVVPLYKTSIMMPRTIGQDGKVTGGLTSGYAQSGSACSLPYSCPQGPFSKACELAPIQQGAVQTMTQPIPSNFQNFTDAVKIRDTCGDRIPDLELMPQTLNSSVPRVSLYQSTVLQSNTHHTQIYISLDQCKYQCLSRSLLNFKRGMPASLTILEFQINTHDAQLSQMPAHSYSISGLLQLAREKEDIRHQIQNAYLTKPLQTLKILVALLARTVHQNMQSKNGRNILKKEFNRYQLPNPKIFKATLLAASRTSTLSFLPQLQFSFSRSQKEHLTRCDDLEIFQAINDNLVNTTSQPQIRLYLPHDERQFLILPLKHRNQQTEIYENVLNSIHKDHHVKIEEKLSQCMKNISIRHIPFTQIIFLTGQ